MSFPYICECDRYISRMLEKLDKNIYNTESTTSNLYYFVEMMNGELCEAYAQLIFAQSDIYLWVDVIDEPVIKGELNGIDCFQNWAVVEIIRVGNTPGASDYEEYVDYQRHIRGIEWTVPQYYGYYPFYGYGYGGWGYEWREIYNPWAPSGRMEPPEGSVYYVTYRYGVRDENLYDNFGVLAKLQKRDFWSYEEYRRAIKSLNIAYLGGPTIDNIKDALSTFHNRDYIEIVEGLEYGWILGVSILYSKSAWENPSLDTSDGTVLTYAGAGQFEFEVRFHYAITIPFETRLVLG